MVAIPHRIVEENLNLLIIDAHRLFTARKHHPEEHGWKNGKAKGVPVSCSTIETTMRSDLLSLCSLANQQRIWTRGSILNRRI